MSHNRIVDGDLGYHADDRLGKLRRFSELFWETWGAMGWTFAAADTGVTYVFELCGPDNPIILQYDTPFVSLLAARRIADGVELDVRDVCAVTGWRHPTTTPVTCVQQALDMVAVAGRLALEGYVIRHATSFYRLKVQGRSSSCCF